MALFTDADLVAVADLSALDSEIDTIAAAEGLAASTFISQAWEECADAVSAVLSARDSGGSDPVLAGITGARVSLSQIVTSGNMRAMSALSRWALYVALKLFYRAASNRKLTDRMTTKLERAIADSSDAWGRVKGIGLGYVYAPLPCPGAVREYGAGVFAPSAVTAVTGGSSAATASYYVAVTWIDGSSYVSSAARGNAESGPSAMLSVAVLTGKTIAVSVAGVIPPSGAAAPAPQAGRAIARRTATGWNVYVGTSADRMYLQNGAPIPVATLSYTLAGNPVLSGAELWPGQVPDATFQVDSVVSRG